MRVLDVPPYYSHQKKNTIQVVAGPVFGNQLRKRILFRSWIVVWEEQGLKFFAPIAGDIWGTYSMMVPILRVFGTASTAVLFISKRKSLQRISNELSGMNYFPKVVIIFILSGIFSNTNVELKVGESAPDFSLKDQNGVIHKLSDYRGKQVVIYFFPKAGTPG